MAVSSAVIFLTTVLNALTPLEQTTTTLPRSDLEKWGIDTPGHWDEAAAVSVQVDGHLTRVATLSWGSSAGCTRDVDWGVELDDAGKVADTLLTRSLLNVKSGKNAADFWANTGVAFFIFEDRPVVVRTLFSTRTVGWLTSEGIKPACEIEEREQYSVVPVVED